MRLGKIVLVFALPGVLVLQAPAAHAGAPYYTTATGVAAYDFNINKMDRNWQGWIDDIKAEATYPVPDVILGQDFENLNEVVTFEDRLDDPVQGFGENYSYVFYSTSQFPNIRVIFWRDSRFNYAASDTWHGWGGTASTGCVEHAENTAAIQVRLWDFVAGKYLAAVSMKTPPKDTNECAWKNAQLMTTKMNRSGWSGDLHLIGTDANAPDHDGTNYTCWWRGTVVENTNTLCSGIDLGYSDVIYTSCNGGRSCVAGNWTHANKRIDFLFAKRGPNGSGAVSNRQRTIGYGNCTIYSDHCSVRAVVGYGLSL